ncbi:ketopantoate reductase family protein [Solimonas terrae]|uniref:2-dehydropantoate 2-reductase n=1 Tax=Solimonas terrae TaxID=1396819 RepID=A0A6M2BVD9_9GAMM|nr:ketopantoate reductase C-terminal domain-containing protein [Solimonas terrae]NGY06093.1 hypothetical protein [Solimonas terrae]
MILLIGAGAVGTTIAAFAVAAGREPVQVHVRDKNRADFEAATALRVERGGTPLVVARPGLRTTLDLHDVDYLLIGVKHPQLDALIDSLPPLPPGCTIVSTLNGLSALRRLRERLPGVRVVPMTVMFNAQLLGPLHTELTTRAEIYIGSDDRRLLRAFAAPRITVRSSHGEAAAWGKLLINLANAICALSHATFEDLLKPGPLRAIYVAILDEAIGVLRASGTPFRLPMPIPHAWYRSLLAGRSSLPWHLARRRNGLRERAYPSMVADVEQGKPTEVNELNGEIVRLAASHGLAAPRNQRLVELVSAMSGAPPHYWAAAELRQRVLGD